VVDGDSEDETSDQLLTMLQGSYVRRRLRWSKRFVRVKAGRLAALLSLSSATTSSTDFKSSSAACLSGARSRRYHTCILITVIINPHSTVFRAWDVWLWRCKYANRNTIRLL